MGNQSVFTVWLIAIVFGGLATGCVSIPFMGTSGANSITFAEGELRSEERAPFEDLNLACHAAIEALGYDSLETLREDEQGDDDHIRWQAQTAGGDPVEIHLNKLRRKRSQLRIRIGLIGDEARSRLVLEEIHRSLSAQVADDR